MVSSILLSVLCLSLILCCVAVLDRLSSVSVPVGKAALVHRGVKTTAHLKPGRYYYWPFSKTVTYLDMRDRTARARIDWNIQGVQVEILAVLEYRVLPTLVLQAANISDPDRYLADLLHIYLARTAPHLHLDKGDLEAGSLRKQLHEAMNLSVYGFEEIGLRVEAVRV